MGMRCYYCNKKLNIFSDYKQIVIDGEKQEVCRKCRWKMEKEKMKQMAQTKNGKMNVGLLGTIFFIAGIFFIGLGIYFMMNILTFYAIVFIVIGGFSIYEGISYIKISRKT